MYVPSFIRVHAVPVVMCVCLASFAHLSKLCGYDLPHVVLYVGGHGWVPKACRPRPCPLLALFGVHDKLLFGRLGAIAGGYSTSVPCPHAALLAIVLRCGKL